MINLKIMTNKDRINKLAQNFYNEIINYRKEMELNTSLVAKDAAVFFEKLESKLDDETEGREVYLVREKVFNMLKH